MLTDSGAIRRYFLDKYGVSIDRTTIYKWLRNGKLKSVRISKVGSRHRYYVTEEEADYSLSRFFAPARDIDKLVVDLQKEFSLERV